MKIIITGSQGFIGRNLAVRLQQVSEFEIVHIHRQTSQDDLIKSLSDTNLVVHLAGINRPQKLQDFESGNVNFTHTICNYLLHKNPVPIIFSSSIQAEMNNPYGNSKRDAEKVLLNYQQSASIPVLIYRLPNVFGKWCRPNYNSAIATFCHNIARGKSIDIHNSDTRLKLVYIDDVINSFLQNIQIFRSGNNQNLSDCFVDISPVYVEKLGDIVALIQSFKKSRDTLITEPVGQGFARALHSTYLSYLPPEQFSYLLPEHTDPRGKFVEILKTRSSGQFSFFSALPGVTRGNHYHHSKTEKFLVIKGKACFRFRNILSNEEYEIFTDERKLKVVETVPGWTHNITNVGKEEMIVILWANEIFDRANPDTYADPV